MTTLNIHPRHNNDEKRLLFFIILLLLLLFGAAAFSGCNSEKHFQKVASEHPDWLQTKDSVSTTIKKIPIDTTITLKGDHKLVDTNFTAPVILPFKLQKGSFLVDTLLPFKLHISASHNTGASLHFKILHDTVSANCACDSLIGVVQYWKTEFFKLQQKTIIVPQKDPTWWDKVRDKWCEIWGWIALFALIGLAIWKLGPVALKLISKIPGLPF